MPAGHATYDKAVDVMDAVAGGVMEAVVDGVMDDDEDAVIDTVVDGVMLADAVVDAVVDGVMHTASIVRLQATNTPAGQVEQLVHDAEPAALNVPTTHEVHDKEELDPVTLP